jgi:hypothetical protein
MTTTNPEVATFGLAARRLFGIASAIRPWLPGAALPWAADLIGRRYSPYRPGREQTLASLMKALDLPRDRAEGVWRQILASQGLFALTVPDYGRLSARWLARSVDVDDAACLAEIVRGGGYVISAHTYHHNTLGCVLGLAGAHAIVLAASARSSPFYEWIGPDIERINGGSQRHFGGGTYVFTDDPANALSATERILSAGQVVVSMCDVPRAGDAPHLARASLLGKTVCPSAGAVDVAVRAGVPIYVALLFPVAGRLQLRTSRIADLSGTAVVLQQFFDQLERVIREYPAAWQGWDWYHGLAAAD